MRVRLIVFYDKYPQILLCLSQFIQRLDFRCNFKYNVADMAVYMTVIK